MRKERNLQYNLLKDNPSPTSNKSQYKLQMNYYNQEG